MINFTTATWILALFLFVLRITMSPTPSVKLTQDTNITRRIDQPFVKLESDIGRNITTIISGGNVSINITHIAFTNQTNKFNKTQLIEGGFLNVSYSSEFVTALTLTSNITQVASSTSYITEGSTGEMNICQIGNTALNPNNTAFLNSSLIDVIDGNFVIFFENNTVPSGSFIIARGDQITGVEQELFRITSQGVLMFFNGSEIRVATENQSKFFGFDQSIVLKNNQTVGEGVIEFALINNDRDLELWHSGKPDSAGFHRNSYMISTDFGLTNASVLSSCERMATLMGIDLIIGCNTTDLGAGLLLEGSARIGHSLYVGGGNKTASDYSLKL